MEGAFLVLLTFHNAPSLRIINTMCERIPSASGHTSTTPTSAANASGSAATSKSSVVSGVDLLTGSTAATISPERQQQLAAAAVAAAAANALGNSFLTARSPVQISTSGTGGNPLGQFASQVYHPSTSSSSVSVRSS